MENWVPSTSLTRAVSDLTPESSTTRMDLAESLRMISNSERVTEGRLGMGAALARLLGSVMVRARRVLVAMVVRAWRLEEVAVAVDSFCGVETTSFS